MVRTFLKLGSQEGFDKPKSARNLNALTCRRAFCAGLSEVLCPRSGKPWPLILLGNARIDMSQSPRYDFA